MDLSKLESLTEELSLEAEEALSNLYFLIQRKTECEDQFYQGLSKLNTSEKIKKWSQFIYSGHIEKKYSLNFLFSEARRYIITP